MAKVLGSGSKSGEVSCLEGLASWVSCELWFWTAREPRGERASRSAEGESLDVSEATYKIKRERSHGVVSSSSGRERPR